MPPRFAYWTILIDGQPTAFRAREAQELLPTLAQLKRTNKDVLLRWFARGKLWDSPDAERAAGRARTAAPARGPEWRPGGAHKDPRAFWRDKKKERNQQRRAEKHQRRERGQQRFAKPDAARSGERKFGTGSRRPRFGKPLRRDEDRSRPEGEPGSEQRRRPPRQRPRKPGPPKR